MSSRCLGSGRYATSANVGKVAGGTCACAAIERLITTSRAVSSRASAKHAAADLADAGGLREEGMPRTLLLRLHLVKSQRNLELPVSTRRVFPALAGGARL